MSGMSEQEQANYIKTDEREETVETYTFIVCSYFREKDAQSIDDVIRSLVLERANCTFAAQAK